MQDRPQLETELERETCIGIVKVHAGDAGDALQAVGQCIAVDVQ